MNVNDPPLLRCADACGRAVTPEEAEHTGWTYLEIQRRWRCPQCQRELRATNQPLEQ